MPAVPDTRCQQTYAPLLVTTLLAAYLQCSTWPRDVERCATWQLLAVCRLAEHQVE